MIIDDLMALSHRPRALIGALDHGRPNPPMATIDARNARFDRGEVVPARAGLVEERDWNAEYEMRTPRYTTQIGELTVTPACCRPCREASPTRWLLWCSRARADSAS